MNLHWSSSVLWSAFLLYRVRVNLLNVEWSSLDTNLASVMNKFMRGSRVLKHSRSHHILQQEPQQYTLWVIVFNLQRARATYTVCAVLIILSSSFIIATGLTKASEASVKPLPESGIKKWAWCMGMWPPTTPWKQQGPCESPWGSSTGRDGNRRWQKGRGRGQTTKSRRWIYNFLPEWRLQQPQMSYARGACW